MTPEHLRELCKTYRFQDQVPVRVAPESETLAMGDVFYCSSRTAYVRTGGQRLEFSWTKVAQALASGSPLDPKDVVVHAVKDPRPTRPFEFSQNMGGSYSRFGGQTRRSSGE